MSKLKKTTAKLLKCPRWGKKPSPAKIRELRRGMSGEALAAYDRINADCKRFDDAAANGTSARNPAKQRKRRTPACNRAKGQA